MTECRRLQLDESAEADASVGTTKDVFEELLSHQLLLQMYGSISEVSLLIAGRSPVSWWPPDGIATQASASGTLAHARSSSVQSELPLPAPAAAAAAVQGVSSGGQGHELALTPSGAGAFAAAAVDALAASTPGQQAPGGSSSSTAAGLLVPLAEEVDLVAIKFQGAQVGVTVSGDGFSTEVAMAALTIDDLLVGAKNPDKAHMAQSSTVWQQQKSPKQEQPWPPKILQQQQPGEQGKTTTGEGTNWLGVAAAFQVDISGRAVCCSVLAAIGLRCKRWHALFTGRHLTWLWQSPCLPPTLVGTKAASAAAAAGPQILLSRLMLLPSAPLMMKGQMKMRSSMMLMKVTQAGMTKQEAWSLTCCWTVAGGWVIDANMIVKMMVLWACSKILSASSPPTIRTWSWLYPCLTAVVLLPTCLLVVLSCLQVTHPRPAACARAAAVVPVGHLRTLSQ